MIRGWQRSFKLLLPIVLMVALGACVPLPGQSKITSTASQPAASGVGTVVIQVQTCPVDGSNNCTTTSSTAANSTFMLGFRVPSALTPPVSFTDTGATLTLTRNASYEALLAANNPPDPGYTWYGYATAPMTGTTNTSLTIFDVPFGLPQQPAGAAFDGPVKYQVVQGAQQTVSDPVTCNAGINSICAGINVTNTPTDANYAILTDLTAHISFASRDLGIAGSSTASVAAGSSTTVPFTVNYDGPVLPVGQTFTMGASSTGPGFSATPSAGTLSPAADSSAGFNVNLTVPSGTPAGSYNVTLTATAAGGFSRSATSTVTVTDATAPTPNPMTASAVADSATQVTVTASLASDETALHATPYSVDTGAASWQASRTFVKGGLSANTQYTWTVRARDAVGNASTGTVQRYTLPNAPTAAAFTGSDWTSGSQNQLTLSWSAPAGGAASYNIRTSPGNALVANVAGTSRAFTGLGANTSLTYKVCAVNADGAEESTCSNVATGTTPPNGPGSATTSSITTSSVDVDWPDVVGATQYVINLWSDSGCSSSLGTITGIAASQHSATSLLLDRYYAYTIQSYGGTGALGAPSACRELTSTTKRTAVDVAIDSATSSFADAYPGDDRSASTTITVTTRMTGTFDLLASMDHQLQNSLLDLVPLVGNGGTPLLPLPWGLGYGFGVTMSGATANVKWGNGSNYATLLPIATSLNTTSGLNTNAGATETTVLNVGYRFRVPPTQAAGDYSATVSYTVVPSP